MWKFSTRGGSVTQSTLFKKYGIMSVISCCVHIFPLFGPFFTTKLSDIFQYFYLLKASLIHFIRDVHTHIYLLCFNIISLCLISINNDIFIKTTRMKKICWQRWWYFVHWMLSDRGTKVYYLPKQRFCGSFRGLQKWRYWI